MEDPTDTLRVETTHPNTGVAFRGPSGIPVTGQLSEVSILTKDGEVRECGLRFVVDYAMYLQLEQRGDFHLTPSVRKKNFRVQFSSTETVEIRLVLDPGRLHLLGLVTNGMPLAEQAAKRLRRRGSNELFGVDAWYVTHATQGRGALKAGYVTTWADEMRIPRPRFEIPSS